MENLESVYLHQQLLLVKKEQGVIKDGLNTVTVLLDEGYTGFFRNLKGKKILVDKGSLIEFKLDNQVMENVFYMNRDFVKAVVNEQ